MLYTIDICHHIYYLGMYVGVLKDAHTNAMMPHPLSPLYEMCLTRPTLDCAILFSLALL